MLQLNELSLTLGKREILKDISFSLGKGETLSIIGPSGCGKSTLLLAIANLKEKTMGEMMNDFEETALILQHHGLFPWKTIEQNIKLPLVTRSFSKQETQAIVNDIAAKLNIDHLLGNYPSQVSGGERQRVAVARILSLKPQLLLLDEPSSALDSINKERFQTLLLNIQQEYQMAYIIVTHQIEEAVFLGQKIAIMKEGRIQEIIDNPYYGQQDIRKTYTFFDKCNEIRARLEQGEACE